MRKVLMIVCISLIAIVFTASAIYLNRSIFASYDAIQSEKITITIPPETNTLRIGKLLKSKNLINNEYIFLAYEKLKYKKPLKAGKYSIPKGTSMDKIINLLMQGSNVSDTIKLTIPEGFSVEEIADRISALGFNKDEFLSDCNKSDYNYDFIKNISNSQGRKYLLEGYLFPDTYVIKKDAGVKDIINKMLERFNEVVYKSYSSSKKTQSIDSVVNIASMIEKEAKVDKDRSLISSVIYNRINKKMKLQIDATVLYALGYHKSELSLTDLKIASPYNTYYVPALPIGPIGNPGLKSIDAAMNPTKTNYYYYVAQPDGSHVFSENYQQHITVTKEIQNEKTAK